MQSEIEYEPNWQPELVVYIKSMMSVCYTGVVDFINVYKL